MHLLTLCVGRYPILQRTSSSHYSRFKTKSAIGHNPLLKSSSGNASTLSSSKNRNPSLNSSGPTPSIGASKCAGTIRSKSHPLSLETISTHLRTPIGFCAYSNVRTTGGTNSFRSARLTKFSSHPSVQVTTPKLLGSGSSCSGKKYETNNTVFFHPASRASGVSSGIGSDVDRFDMSSNFSGSFNSGIDLGIRATASVTIKVLLLL
mmetsp:Transcript_3767/g.8257  ORF Transcript_3767/g.8257 Transcript_3767/m.8257 type:complete len:206 (-) Transcript_3767:1144-1761(-)